MRRLIRLIRRIDYYYLRFVCGLSPSQLDETPTEIITTKAERNEKWVDLPAIWIDSSGALRREKISVRERDVASVKKETKLYKQECMNGDYGKEIQNQAMKEWR